MGVQGDRRQRWGCPEPQDAPVPDQAGARWEPQQRCCVMTLQTNFSRGIYRTKEIFRTWGWVGLCLVLLDLAP